MDRNCETTGVESDSNPKVIRPDDKKGPEDDNVKVASVELLDFVSEKIIQLTLPVTICALYSCILVRILSWGLTSSRSVFDKTWKRLGVELNTGYNQQANNTFDFTIVTIFCLLIIGVTLLILLVLYMEWHSCLAYYFYVPTLIILAIITPTIARELLLSLNWFALDLITLIIMIWNFSSIGLISIFGLKGLRMPMLCQQFYLIHNSAMLAVLIISILPGWAPWILLAFLVLWDLFAVLAPIGPLNLILDMAERQGIEDMPGLVYSTNAPSEDEPGSQNQIYNVPRAEHESREEQSTTTSSNNKVDSSTSLQQVNTIDSDSGQGTKEAKSQCKKINQDDLSSSARTSTRINEMKTKSSSSRFYGFDERGVTIGLGDFVFYSLLVSLTIKGRELNNYYATLATLNALLVGLVLTLATLALSKRAIPAMPISIGLGVLIAALTKHFAADLSNRLAEEAIFI